ncbi:MAG: methyltransferase domain-containing protein, partial [Myxococcota bacterium]|nr:methyltransferase domain-containing protein [Myxococcota bacterium]
DLTPEMRELAGTRLDQVHAGNVYDIPLEAGTYDLVVTREVLHLLPEPTRPLGEIFRVLKPGGQFIVGQILPFGLADSAWMFRIFKKKQPLVYNQWLDHEFRAMLEGVGFQNVEMTELPVWESIDVWIDTWETTSLHRREIRELFYDEPESVRQVNPFEVQPDGAIRDCWRWCVFSGFKPS